MTILVLYKLLLYGGLVLLVASLVALEVFLNWKYPLPPREEKPRPSAGAIKATPLAAAGRAA
jgi:hypothetical protein